MFITHLTFVRVYSTLDLAKGREQMSTVLQLHYTVQHHLVWCIMYKLKVAAV